MELNQVSTLKPENTACSIAGSGSGSNYTKIIGLLNDFQQELTQLTDKVNARDEVINTGTINAAKNITSAGTISAKDLTATGTLLIEGVANFTDIVVENDIQVKGSLLVDLFEIGDALINNLEVSTGTINSLISDIIKLKSELKRFDTNQNVISFPSPEETQIGDLANNVILAGLKKPKWNEEHLATEEFTALNYYNKEETEQREADELVDAIHRETDIIMGNTPVQRVAKGCVDTEGHLLATTDDAYMLSGAEGRDNIVARTSLDDIKACGMYNVTKVDVANSITEKPTGEEGPFDLIVGYSLADKLKPYQLYVSHTTEKMYIRLSNVDNEFSSWQQFSFVGGSTRPADVGNPIINLKPEYDNEINFYGSNTSPILVFSGHGTNKNVFMFGKNASGELKAKKVMIDGKVACVQDEIKNFAFGAENIPLKAGDNLDTLPLGTYGTVDFNIFSQLLGDKPFNNPFKLFCFKGGVNEAKSKQQLAIEWNSESVALRHTQDGKLWTRWAQVSLKDSNGYVDKAKTADNLNSGAKLDGSPVAKSSDIQAVIDGTTPVKKVSDDATKDGAQISGEYSFYNKTANIKYFELTKYSSSIIIKASAIRVDSSASEMIFNMTESGGTKITETYFVKRAYADSGEVPPNNFITEFVTDSSKNVYIKIPSFSYAKLTSLTKLTPKEVSKPSNIIYTSLNDSDKIVATIDGTIKQTYTMSKGADFHTLSPGEYYIPWESGLWESLKNTPPATNKAVAGWLSVREDAKETSSPQKLLIFTEANTADSHTSGQTNTNIVYIQTYNRYLNKWTEWKKLATTDNTLSLMPKRLKGTDVNKLRELGFYDIVSPINSPIETTNCLCIVTTGSGSSLARVQIFLDWTSEKIFYRAGGDDNWYKWNELAKAPSQTVQAFNAGIEKEI